MLSIPVFTHPVALLTLALSCTLPLTSAQASETISVSAPALTTLPVLVSSPAGIRITLQDVQAELQRAPEATRQAMLARPESVRLIASNLLVRATLAAEAESLQLDRAPALAALLLQARNKLLSDARLQHFEAQNTLSDSAQERNVAELYASNPSRFDQPAQTRARHILLERASPEAPANAQALLAKLRAGEPFEALAQANSLDPGSAAKGGDLGFFGAGRMVKEFEDGLATLTKPGELSEPVLTQYGYHLIRLEERRDKRRQPLSEVREQLTQEVYATIRSESRNQKVQKMISTFTFDQAAIDALAKTATP